MASVSTPKDHPLTEHESDVCTFNRVALVRRALRDDQGISVSWLLPTMLDRGKMDKVLRMDPSAEWANIYPSHSQHIAYCGLKGHNMTREELDGEVRRLTEGFAQKRQPEIDPASLRACIENALQKDAVVGALLTRQRGLYREVLRCAVDPWFREHSLAIGSQLIACMQEKIESPDQYALGAFHLIRNDDKGMMNLLRQQDFREAKDKDIEELRRTDVLTPEELVAEVTLMLWNVETHGRRRKAA